MYILQRGFNIFRTEFSFGKVLTILSGAYKSPEMQQDNLHQSYTFKDSCTAFIFPSFAACLLSHFFDEVEVCSEWSPIASP